MYIPNRDIRRLLKAMDEIAAGNYQEVDISIFKNPIYGKKLNAVIHSLKQANNTYVMRMNEVMESVGDNALIKDTFDQVTSQTTSIHQMEQASQDMENAIQHISSSMGTIRDNTYDISNTYQTITLNMNDSIHDVQESSAKIQIINNQMQDFNEKIKKIGEIINIVKKVSLQSKLLALNASIEAAKAGPAGSGFAIVAGEMQQLSLSTTESAEHITDYVKQLSKDTHTLAISMNQTTHMLHESNIKAERSLKDMEQMNSQLSTIKDRINSIFQDIDTQTSATADFAKQIEHLFNSYHELSDNCIKLGRHVFQIGRYIDKTRSDMVRKSSIITDLDWIRVFEVDHFVLMWRVYNNIVGFERLLSKQVDNPAGCKLGKWLAAQTDQNLINSNEFRQLTIAHTNFHHYAFQSWQAKEEGKDELAINHFHNTYQAFLLFDQAIHALQNKMKQIGYNKETSVPAVQTE